MAEEAAIILDVRVNGAGDAVRIDGIAVELVEFLIAGVIDAKSIGSVGSTDDDAIHRVSLVLGLADVAVFVVSEIANRKERDPGATIGWFVVDKHER